MDEFEKTWKPKDGKLGAEGRPQKPNTGWTGIILAAVFISLIAYATCSQLGQGEPGGAADSAEVVMDTLEAVPPDTVARDTAVADTL